MRDCLIVGGGVVGLSIAWELARRGLSVQLIERGQLGREASWAGAGILPPAAMWDDLPPWESLQAMSYRLHPQWSERLREETGIDNGYRRCGAIHLARRPGEAAALHAAAVELRDDGVRVRQLSAEEIVQRETELAHAALAGKIRAAYLLPDEAQIRNPRHLQALCAACRRAGVELTEGTAALDFEMESDRVAAVITETAPLRARHVCITTGAWTEQLTGKLGVPLSVYPVRGQMLLYRCGAGRLRHIVNEGPRYVVPRDDGHLLVGSTEEDVGFDKRTTAAGLGELRGFAESLLPLLADATLEKSWAGLRPHAVDGFPYIGRVPHLENCYLAAGHYRSGLFTSTGTAVLIGQLICGETPQVDVSAFAINR